jgi:hypothetical protein
VVLAQVEPRTFEEQLGFVQVTVVSVANRLLYSKYVVLSNGNIWLKPPVYIPQQRLGTPVVLVKNPQNWVETPSDIWRNGHDPPPQAALAEPVLVLSQETG